MAISFQLINCERFHPKYNRNRIFNEEAKKSLDESSPNWKMVTSNNVGPIYRFKSSIIMDDSDIERYVRARKRCTARPKCLFGVPSQREVDQYISERNSEELVHSQEKLEKYDLSNIGKNLLEETEGTSDDCATNVRQFQPTIVTENNPPPSKNLFSPIEKVENTEFWQTSKRRRSSEENKTEETMCKSPRVDDDSSEPSADDIC